MEATITKEIKMNKPTKFDPEVRELLDNAHRAIIREKVEELIEQVNARSISIEKAEARAAELKAAYEAI
jgi:hypothetical protein